MAKKNQNQTLAPVIPIDAVFTNGKAVYKVGDWVYYCYELQQVKELDANGKVVKVSDSQVVVTAKEGTNLEHDIVALNPENKAVSDAFKEVAKEFSNYSSTVRLNYSEVYPWLVERWLESIAAGADKDKQKVVADEINRLRQTIVGVINEVQKIGFSAKPETPEDKDSKTPKTGFQLFK